MPHRNNAHTVGAAISGALTFSTVAASLTVFTAGWDTTASSIRFGLIVWLALFPLSVLALLSLAPAEPRAPRLPAQRVSPKHVPHSP
jgi:hypothetical protein